MEDKEKAGISDRIWNFFASVKLTVVILIILPLISIIGTIVEQQADQATNIKLLTKFFGDSAAPAVYNIFVKLGFMDMYRSWWFLGILILFSINLTVCSLERIPKVLRVINNPIKPLKENVIKTLSVKKELSIKADLKKVRDEILNRLTASRYRVFESTEEDSVQLYSQKGKYTRLGVYIVHLSILLIFVGAIIGARFGFRGFLNLGEGEYSTVAYARKGGKTEKIPLNFVIKCNWYNTEYYGETVTPREFQSELVIIDGGTEVLKKVIEVNSPLTYKGITFYQSSYGMMPGVIDEFISEVSTGDEQGNILRPSFSKYPNTIGKFILKVTPKNGQPNTLWLRRGETFEIPGTNITATIIGFSPTLDRDRRTSALGTNTYYKDTMVNPAVAIEVDAPGMEKFIGWFLKDNPTWILPRIEHEIEFVDYRGIEYTGLLVVKDPGVGIIYLACIIMTLGLYVAFFMSHKKLWIRLANEKGFVRISAGGSASKNRLSFEREIDRILSKASRAIEGSTQRSAGERIKK